MGLYQIQDTDIIRSRKLFHLNCQSSQTSPLMINLSIYSLTLIDILLQKYLLNKT